MLPSDWNPPTIADTKQKFYKQFKTPINPIYNTVIQELLVQQHLMRWNINFKYDAVSPPARLLSAKMV